MTLNLISPPRWHSGKTLASHAGEPKPSARHQVPVSRVLGRVTVDFAFFIKVKKDENIDVIGIMPTISFDHLAPANNSELKQPDHKNISVI